MTLEYSEVRDALAQSRGGIEMAALLLRRGGRRFATAEFREVTRDIFKERRVQGARNTGIVGTAGEVVLEDNPAPVIGGAIEAPDERREKAAGSTFVFTCAQANTKLHEGFFRALEAYCLHHDAELHVSRFTYNKQNFGKKSIKPGTGADGDDDDLWYDPRILPHVSDVSLEVAPGLVFCGELNIIPTRINPLSSFKSYTRDASGIIPHAKMCMESVPTMKHLPARFLYTTGACTQRNYIQKSAGQVADFHHVFGALVVEVNEQGEWWARQLNADKTGGFYDLCTYWTADGQHHPGLEVQAITHGDLHMDKIDPAVCDVVWGEGGVVDTLHPHEQFFHDTVDFTPRNHHNIKDSHHLYDRWRRGMDCVDREFKDAAHLLSQIAYREWSRHFIVVSNHDQAIEGWLRNTAAAADPVNARLWHDLNAHCYGEMEAMRRPRPFTYALSMHLPGWFKARSTFLQEDDSYRILGEIEAGMHGHLGPNGARGSPKNLRTAGKANTGHTHSAGIVEGVYTAGVYGQLDMGYNTGLSSWSHSFIITYPNAKRAVCTIKGDRAWR